MWPEWEGFGGASDWWESGGDTLCLILGDVATAFERDDLVH